MTMKPSSFESEIGKRVRAQALAAGRRVRSVLLQHRAGHCRAVTRTELHRLICSRHARCVQARYLRESAHVTSAARLPRSDSEGDHAVEGSEEHFDENVSEEERSTDGEDGSGEEVREKRWGARSRKRAG